MGSLAALIVRTATNEIKSATPKTRVVSPIRHLLFDFIFVLLFI
jgi:hypothetical protein